MFGRRKVIPAKMFDTEANLDEISSFGQNDTDRLDVKKEKNEFLTFSRADSSTFDSVALWMLLIKL